MSEERRERARQEGEEWRKARKAMGVRRKREGGAGEAVERAM
jgi:hypothetical protein